MVKLNLENSNLSHVPVPAEVLTVHYIVVKKIILVPCDSDVQN